MTSGNVLRYICIVFITNQKKLKMKNLIIILLLAFGLNASAQTQSKWTQQTPTPAAQNPAPSNCNCTYPLKDNTSWCVGSRGGIYCINRNGNKTYKPKTK